MAKLFHECVDGKRMGNLTMTLKGMVPFLKQIIAIKIEDPEAFQDIHDLEKVEGNIADAENAAAAAE